jgi:4-alpha-glucanotransferase
MADWWDAADPGERGAVLAILGEAGQGLAPDDRFSGRVRDALLSALFNAGSDFALITLPDLFGWRDRINTPASVNDENWTWRLPWPVEALSTGDDGTNRASFLRQLSIATHRTRDSEP